MQAVLACTLSPAYHPSTTSADSSSPSQQQYSTPLVDPVMAMRSGIASNAARAAAAAAAPPKPAPKLDGLAQLVHAIGAEAEAAGSQERVAVHSSDPLRTLLSRHNRKAAAPVAVAAAAEPDLVTAKVGFLGRWGWTRLGITAHLSCLAAAWAACQRAHVTRCVHS